MKYYYQIIITLKATMFTLILPFVFIYFLFTNDRKIINLLYDKIYMDVYKLRKINLICLDKK